MLLIAPGIGEYSQSNPFVHEGVRPQLSHSTEFAEVETLAFAAGLSLEEFVQSHSLLPLFEMVPPFEKNAISENPSRAEMIARYMPITARTSGRTACWAVLPTVRWF